MAKCIKKYSWYCIAIYDFKQRVKLANSTTIFNREQFDKVDMGLFPTKTKTKTKIFIYLTHFLFITIFVENDFCVH